MLADTSVELQISTIITNTRTWKMELKCNNKLQSSILIPHLKTQNICAISNHTFKWKFRKSGKHLCWVHFTDGIFATSSEIYTFNAFPRLVKALIDTKNIITTNELVTLSVNVLPYLDPTNSSIVWKILNEKGISTIFNSNKPGLFNVPYTFMEAGRFIIQVIASNPFSQIQNETLVTVQDAITDLVVKPHRSILFIKTNSRVHFAANFSKGTDAHCMWIVHCTCDPLQKKHYKFGGDDCIFIHRFVLIGVCNVSLTVTNRVSSVRPRTPWKVFVEEPITAVQAYVPDVVLAGSIIKIEIFLPHLNHEVHAVIRTKSLRVTAIYEPETSIYNAELTTGKRKDLEWLRIRAFNNVSYVVLRRSVLVIPEIGRVSIHSSGCLVIGNSASFIVLVDVCPKLSLLSKPIQYQHQLSLLPHCRQYPQLSSFLVNIILHHQSLGTPKNHSPVRTCPVRGTFNSAIIRNEHVEASLGGLKSLINSLWRGSEKARFTTPAKRCISDIPCLDFRFPRATVRRSSFPRARTD
ncbi:hypothetical protein AVEN_71620-1 [Araneus ventricosus]|uniref:Uncharacterized protein n=1 Tax=Araneus ventricosus TaxID=182803 RepID=A0A4Y2GE96_ARAVE|nr:hypothetical protein AVEN_71620-1 [Araneus ventricosus]